MNQGKKFEQDFKNSVPGDVYYLRLHDSANGFDVEEMKEHTNQRFAAKSPYDVILCKDGKMMALELKSTGGSSVGNITSSQEKELKKAGDKGVFAGFVLNFRKTERTYFVPIKEYMELKEETKKKSINEKDISRIPHVVLPGKKLKVNYRYDLSELLALV